MTLFQELRREPREPLVLQLSLDGGRAGCTRDISPSGLFFELEGEHAFAGTVALELRLRDEHLRFSASGRVLRVEHREGRTGVAVQLTEPRLVALD